MNFEAANWGWLNWFADIESQNELNQRIFTRSHHFHQLNHQMLQFAKLNYGVSRIQNISDELKFLLWKKCQK